MTVMKGVFCPKDKWTQVADATTYQSVRVSLQDTTQLGYFWVYVGASIPNAIPKDGFADAIRVSSTPDNVMGWQINDGLFTGTDKLFICPDKEGVFHLTQW